jgi:hypothetical protein
MQTSHPSLSTSSILHCPVPPVPVGRPAMIILINISWKRSRLPRQASLRSQVSSTHRVDTTASSVTSDTSSATQPPRMRTEPHPDDPGSGWDLNAVTQKCSQGSPSPYTVLGIVLRRLAGIKGALTASPFRHPDTHVMGASRFQATSEELTWSTLHVGGLR